MNDAGYLKKVKADIDNKKALVSGLRSRLRSGKDPKNLYAGRDSAARTGNQKLGSSTTSTIAR